MIQSNYSTTIEILKCLVK